MYRTGLVTEQDLTLARVRVRFPARDNLISWWLQVAGPKTQNDKHYLMPDIGEQVVCLMDEHDEDGCVIGSVYSTADATPVQSADKWHVTAKDNATFEYDRSAHNLAVTIPPGGSMSVAIGSGGTITLTANGATLEIDSGGNILLTPGALIKLAGGGPAIARVGDQTVCPAGTGVIVSGSSKAFSG